MINSNKKYGFTLMELMVAVIIIAVLAAVAVPQYKHAVLKSRFSTVMPKAKAISDAQEVYYLANGEYADNKANLDVEPVVAENTTVEVSGAKENADENYLYVVASRSDIPGARYIQYQKHSPKFAGNIHCEADSTDEEALWLCEKGLQGHEIEGSLQGEDYKTYLLEGELSNSSNDYFAKACSGSGEKACDCGGPVTGSCDDRSGEWEYDTECPQPLTTGLEADCDEGYTGKKTRVGDVCKNGAYTYGEWVESCTPTGPIPTCAGGTKVGEKLKDSQGNVVTDQQGNELLCVKDCSSGACEYKYESGQVISIGLKNATTAYAYAGSIFTGGVCRPTVAEACTSSVFEERGTCQPFVDKGCSNSIFKGPSSSCDVVDGGNAYSEGGCAGSTFTESAKCFANKSFGCANATFESGGTCYGYKLNGCSSSTFNGGRCLGQAQGGCAGAILKAGSYCQVADSGGCDGASYGEGSWCEKGDYACPAGSPAGYGGQAFLGQCWNSTGKKYGSQYCNN